MFIIEGKPFWNNITRRNIKKMIMSPFSDESDYEYEKRFDDWGEQDANKLLKFITPASIVLEIGCGIGRIMKYLAPHCNKIWGVDVSKKIIRSAKIYLKGIENVKLIINSGYDLAFIPGGLFDFIYSFLLFQHINEKAQFKYLQEAYRVLKPGGKCFFQFLNILGNEGFKHFLNTLETTYPLFLNTKDEVAKKLAFIGFHIEDIIEDPVNILVYVKK